METRKISLWYAYEDDLMVNDLYLSSNRVWEKTVIISPTLKSSLKPLFMWFKRKQSEYEVMMPIPLDWAKGYLTKHNRLLYDELLYMVKHARKVYEPLPFSWITPVSFFEDDQAFRFQRYMAAKEMSWLDNGMVIIGSTERFENQQLASVGDIYRMRQREHLCQPVWSMNATEISEHSGL